MGRGFRIGLLLSFLFLLSLTAPLHAQLSIAGPSGGGGTGACAACENLSEYNTSTMFLITDDQLQTVEIAFSWGPNRQPVKYAPIIVTVKASSGTSAAVNPAAAHPSALFAPAGSTGESPTQPATSVNAPVIANPIEVPHASVPVIPPVIFNPTTAPPTQMYVTYTDEHGLATFNYSPFNDSCHDYQFFYCYAPAGCGLSNCFQALGLDPVEVHYASVDEIPLAPGQTTRPTMDQQDPQKVLSNIQTYTFCPPPPNYGTGTPPFCLPLVLIFSLLAGALFLSGRNPFSMFDFSTARMGKHFRYMARGRGFGFDLYAIAKGLVTAGKITAGGKAGRAAVRESEKQQVEAMLAPYKKAAGAVKMVVSPEARKASRAEARKQFGPGVMREGGFWSRAGQRLGNAFVKAGGLLNQRAAQRLAPVFQFGLADKLKGKVGFWDKVWAGFKAISAGLMVGLFRMTVFAELLRSLREMVISIRSYNSTAEALAAMANLRGVAWYNGQKLNYSVVVEKDRDGNPILDSNGRPKMSIVFTDDKGRVVLTATMGANGMLVFRDAKGKIMDQKDPSLQGVMRDLNRDMLSTMNKVYLSLSFMAPIELADRKRELMSRVQDIMDECKKKGEKAVAADTIDELKNAISKLEVVSRNELAPILAIIDKAEKSGNYVDACFELGRLTGVQKEAMVSLLGADAAKSILGSADAVVQYATFFTPEGFNLMKRQQADRIDSLTRAPPDVLAAMGNVQAALQGKDPKAVDAAFSAFEEVAAKYKTTNPALSVVLTAAIAEVKKTGDFSAISSFILTGKPQDLQKAWETAQRTGDFREFAAVAAKYKDVLPGIAALNEEVGKRVTASFSSTVFSGVTVTPEIQKGIDAAIRTGDYKSLDDLAKKNKDAMPELAAAVAVFKAVDAAVKTGDFKALDALAAKNPEVAKVAEAVKAVDVVQRTGDAGAVYGLAPQFAKYQEIMPALTRAVDAFYATGDTGVFFKLVPSDLSAAIEAARGGNTQMLDRMVEKYSGSMPGLADAVTQAKATKNFDTLSFTAMTAAMPPDVRDAVGTAIEKKDFSQLEAAMAKYQNIVAAAGEVRRYQEGMPALNKAMDAFYATGDISVFYKLAPTDISAAIEAARGGNTQMLDRMVERYSGSMPGLADAVKQAKSTGDFDSLAFSVVASRIPPDIREAIGVAIEKRDFSQLEAVMARYQNPAADAAIASAGAILNGFKAVAETKVQISILPTEIANAQAEAVRTGNYDRFFATLAALEPASAGFKALAKAVGTEQAEAIVGDAKKMTAAITITQSIATGLGRMTAIEIENRGLTELKNAVDNSNHGAVIQWMTDPDNAGKVPEILRASTSFSGQVTGSMESGSSSAAYLYAFRGELSTPVNASMLAAAGLSELPAVIGKGGEDLKKYVENNGDKLKAALGEDGYRKLSESATGAAVFTEESKRFTSQFSAYSDADLKRTGLYEVKAALASGDPFALRSALEKPGVFDALNNLAPKTGLQEAAARANSSSVFLTEIVLPTVKKDMPEFAAAIRQGPDAVKQFLSDPANAAEVQKRVSIEGKKPEEVVAMIRSSADDIVRYPAAISQAAAELSKLPNEQIREFGLDRGVLAALNKGDPAAVSRLLSNPEVAGKLEEAIRERAVQRASDAVIGTPASLLTTREVSFRGLGPAETAYAMATNLDSTFGTYNKIREHLNNDDYNGLARTLAGGQGRESMLAVEALANNSSSFHEVAKEAIQIRVAEHLAGGAMAQMRAIERLQENQKTADDLSKTYLQAVGPLDMTHPNKPSEEFIGILRDKDPERLATFIADKRNEGDLERVAAAFGVGKENVRGELQQMADGWRAPVNINNTGTLYAGTMMLAYNALPQQAFMAGLNDTKTPTQTVALTESFFSGIYAAERQREQLRAQFDIAAASPTTNVAALGVPAATAARVPDTIQRDQAMDISRFYEARAEALKPENREKDPQRAERLEAARPVVERAMDAVAREKDPARGAELLLYSRAIAQNTEDPARLAQLSASLERYTQAKTPEAKSLETERMLGLDSAFAAKDSVKHEALATYPTAQLRDFAKQKLPGSAGDIEKTKDEDLVRFVAARIPDRDVDAFIKRQGDPQVTVSGDKKIKYSEAAEACVKIEASVVKAKTRVQVEEPRELKDIGVHAREFKPKASTAYKPNDVDEWIMTPGTPGQRGMIYDPITKTMRPI